MDYKNRIIEEAASLFRTYGIKTVTMDLLASKLGISKRTIYEVFSDKDELLIGVVKWMSEKQKETMNGILQESENVIVANFRMINVIREHFQNMSPAFILDIKKYHHSSLSEMKGKGDFQDSRDGMEILTRGIKEGLFRKNIKVELVNRCIYELIRISCDYDIFPPDKYSRNDIIKNVYINYLRGIATPKGIEIINEQEKKMELG